MRHKEVKAIETAKTEKVKEMGAMTHLALASLRLAKWNPQNKGELNNRWFWTVQVGALTMTVEVPKEAPIEIWDEIVAQLEKLEKIEVAQK